MKRNNPAQAPAVQKTNPSQTGSAQSPGGNGSKRPKNIGKALKRIFGYVAGRHKTMFIFVIASILLAALTGVLGSTMLQTLVDGYIVPLLKEANPNFTGLMYFVLRMAGIYVLSVACSWFYNRYMAIIGQKVLKEIRDDMFGHMQTLPIRYFDTHTHGDIMSCYTNDTDTLRQMIIQSTPMIISSAMTAITVLVAMFLMNWILALIVVVVMTGMLFVMSRITRSSSKYFFHQQVAIADVNGHIEEIMNGQKVVKVFCHEEKAKEEFDERNEDLFRTAYAANKFANILMPIMQNMGTILYVILAVIGGYLAIQGIAGITLGTVIAFLQLTRNFTNPVSQMSQQVNFVITALAGAERIFALVDSKSETDEGYVTLVNAEISEDGTVSESDSRTGKWAWKHPHKSDGTITYTPLTGEVQFFDVDFGYVPEKIVLHDVTLDAKPGEKFAFVGATGAGKTTITNLINRFYDIADGKIRYDGININKIKKDDLRRSLGVVLQDVNLFTGTIRENIKYGKLDATDEEVVEAGKLANADDFISRLPNGYDTMLTANGANLSQGQRQLLSIARAAIADPPVMILDEATSSIDTRTEAIVQRGMDSLMHGRTVFVIAHRLSTVQNSDEIIVLDHGSIIESGNHGSLIAQKGKYYQLYTGAFELE